MESDPDTTTETVETSPPAEKESPSSDAKPGTARKAAKRPRKRKAAPRKAVKKKPKEEPRPKTRLVIFLRHGIAEESTPDKPDEERSLTTAGHDRTKRSTKGLSKFVSKVDAIISSPLLRALQTALWATKAYGGKVKVQTTDALRPEANPEELRKLIRETEGASILLIGHEPNLTRCMADLLGAAGLSANLRRAGCAAVRLDEDGRGTLEWLLAPKTLRSL